MLNTPDYVQLQLNVTIDLQFYEELTVARVKTVKFISGAFFWPTGQLVLHYTNSGFLTYTVSEEVMHTDFAPF